MMDMLIKTEDQHKILEKDKVLKTEKVDSFIKIITKSTK